MLTLLRGLISSTIGRRETIDQPATGHATEKCRAHLEQGERPAQKGRADQDRIDPGLRRADQKRRGRTFGRTLIAQAHRRRHDTTGTQRHRHPDQRGPNHGTQIRLAHVCPHQAFGKVHPQYAGQEQTEQQRGRQIQQYGP